jgi:hypothetical protein
MEAAFFMKCFLSGAILWAFLAGTAPAVSISLICEDVTLPYSSSPQTGSLEIYVNFTSGTSLAGLYALNTSVSLSPMYEGVAFNSFAKTTTHSYAFDIGADGGQGGPWGDTDYAYYMDGQDFTDSPNGLTLKNNAGVMKMGFSVDGGVSGKYDVFISNAHNLTNMISSSGTPIYYNTIKSGSITISPAPEPGLLVLIIPAALFTLFWFKKVRTN